MLALPVTLTVIAVESTLPAASCCVGDAATVTVAVLVPAPCIRTTVEPLAFDVVPVAATENVVGPVSNGPVPLSVVVQDVPPPALVIVTDCGPLRVENDSVTPDATFDVVAVTVMPGD